MQLKIGSKLLYIKMVFLFVLFGILVSYVSFLTGVGIHTYEIYRDFRTGYRNDMKKVIEDDPDFFYKAFVNETAVGNEIKRILKTILPIEENDNLRLTLYTREKDEQIWRQLMNLPETGFQIVKVPPSNNLNKTIGRTHLFNPQMYLGGERSRAFFLNLTRNYDSRYYVIEVELIRNGLKSMLNNRKESIYSSTIVIVVFSVLLGSLFSKSITKPLHNLSGKALAFADGNMNILFSTHRLDDIGVLSRSIDKMSRNLKHRLLTMQTMNSIDRAVLSSVSRDDLIMMVADLISLQYGHSPVCLFETREEGLVMSAMVPDAPQHLGRLLILSEVPWEMKDLSSSMILSREEMDEYKGSFSSALPDELKREKVVVIPIRQNEQLMALFCINLDEVGIEDIETLEMLSDQLGVALRSKKEMDQREELYHGTLIALTRSVDAKSRWTAGHSERVARISLTLAGRLNLKEEDMSIIRIGSLLHDIGKLGIPESILDKPGKLTDEEYDLIKSHPAKGDTIIKDIPGMEKIRLAVRHHHERWDGRGYPDGLKGDQIPLSARILTLADIYDALTEDRPYRTAFTREEATQFLLDNRGSIFDPELLDAFVELLSSTPL